MKIKAEMLGMVEMGKTWREVRWLARTDLNGGSLFVSISTDSMEEGVIRIIWNDSHTLKRIW